jgi:hypothetical protein
VLVKLRELRTVISPLFAILIFVSGIGSTEKVYTGSTPADPAVRSFLGIPLADSVDFIRWKITLGPTRYEMDCNYGIGKANTNGFINGGATIVLSGEYSKERNVYRLKNGVKALKVVELNPDLLHLLNADESLLVGTAGWSYTLNSMTPSRSDQISITAAPTTLKDSITFVGRTPCNVPGVSVPGKQCYKLKWHVVLYAGTQMNKPGRYRILGTPWREDGGKTGSWKIITGRDGRIIFQLNEDSGNALLYLLKLDERILVFTDAQGRLLVGDEDFSYTLNGR